MINVAVIGVGGISAGHINAYGRLAQTRLIALCDKDPERASGKGRSVTINIDTGEQAPLDVTSYTDWQACLADPRVEMVDICLPSDLHAPVAIAALEAGKHVLCEKPMALNAADAARMIDAAAASGRQLMIAQVIRFWPEYLALKEAVDRGTYGKLRTATFRRISSVPLWTSDGWMTDPVRGGGVGLDLHVHDVDFINFLLGMPREVYARGVEERYGIAAMMGEFRYDDEKVIYAESAWLPAPGVPFRMPYLAYFEGAVFDYEQGPLTIYPVDGEPFKPEFTGLDAMTAEIAYFVECIEQSVAPALCTPASTRDTIRLIEAEYRSIRTGRAVSLIEESATA